MKRFIALFLVLVMAFSFVACGEGTTQNSSGDGNTQQGGNAQQSGTADGPGETETNEVTFTQLVAVDNEECAIKITGIDSDNFWGYALKVQLENKSADKTYMFSVESAAINGVQCDPLFATDVVAGKKANEEITFFDSEFEGINIGNFTDIELTFRVYDSNDWLADEIARETVHVYPYGQEKAVKFVREPQASDTVVMDNEHVTVIVTGYEKDEIWGYSANVYLVNKTDKDLMFSVKDASVNGYMADPFFATDVAAGKCTFNSITWFESTFEENGITEVEEIEFQLRVYDVNDWRADDFANEKIILNP